MGFIIGMWSIVAFIILCVILSGISSSLSSIADSLKKIADKDD